MSMDRRSTLSVPALLGLALFAIPMVTACGGDSDGDGLSNKEEKELGLDPDLADSDGDGLSDGDEIEFGSDPLNPDADGDFLNDADELAAGSDPNNPDTDGDSYLDGDEFVEGTDPADSASRIYKGYWPYNRLKDDLGDGNWSVTFVAGDQFPRHKGKDQFGDTLDIYDYGGDDQDHSYIIIDASATWCGPCQATSEWLAGGVDYYDLEPSYGAVREGIDDGTLVWVTVMTDNASVQEVKAWDEDYPNENIPVMVDKDGRVQDAVNTAGGYVSWPRGVILKASSMKVKEANGIVPALLEDALNYL